MQKHNVMLTPLIALIDWSAKRMGLRPYAIGGAFGKAGASGAQESGWRAERRAGEFAF